MAIESRGLPFDRPDPMEPPPAYAELREAAPVARVTMPGGQPAWLVTSYDAAATVLSDPRFGMAPPGPDQPGNDTLFQDGATHDRLRRLVGRAFTARRIAGLRPRIEELADDHVRAMARMGPPADLVEGIAAPLAIAVISELIGVAIDERDHFRALADAVSAADIFDTDVDALAAGAKAWEALTDYAAAVVAAKRRNLGDDLVTDLIGAHDTQDGRLSDGELIGMVTSIVAAGYVTASNAISAGAIELMTEGLLTALAADPEQVDLLIEEVLRRQSGLIGEPFPRWVQQDLELSGVSIMAGEMILVRLGAANRDPARFTEPDRFIPVRPESHMAFGRGPHHCLGAALARVELSAAFRSLAEQLPGLQLVGTVDDIVWTSGGIDTGPVAIHVTW